VTVDVGRDAATARIPTGAPKRSRRPASDDQPVEFWPTAAIREALETDDLTVWQRIVVAIKRDPYGRTARQVEEVLESTRPYGVSKALSEVLTRARQVMATYADMEELIRLGAYRAGSSAEVDEAIGLHQPLEQFLAQLKEESTPLNEGYAWLAQIVAGTATEN